MKTRYLLLFVSLAMLATGAGIYARSRMGAHRPAAPGGQRPFTLLSKVTMINPSDGSQIVQEKTRYVSSDGSWRVFLSTGDGKKGSYFFAPGRGFFQVNERDKTLIRDDRAAVTPPAPMTAEQLRAHKQFVRTEKVLGLECYVLRTTDEATGLPVSDTYYAVEAGNIPLKSVEYYAGKPQIIDEPVSISFGEPDPRLVSGPDYPPARR